MKRYPGPLAFSTEQESIFFGRDNDIKELSELIFVERMVLLYSKSGYGKTSLLNAGVEPKLKNNKNFEFIKIRFYNESNSTITPNDRFITTVKQNADFVNTENQRTIIDIYAKNYLNEYWSVFKKNQMAGNHNKTYILIFDQFEELFSYPTEQINEFKNKLADILHVNRPPRFLINFEGEIFRDKGSIDNAQLDQLYQPANIKVVFSIRSDRLSKLNMLADKIHDIQKVFYELKPLTDEQLRKAIEIPANKPGQYDSNPFTFTPAAIDKIIAALSLKGTKTVSTTTLQIICQRIEGDFIPKEDEKKEFILKNNADNIIEAEELPDFKDIFLDFYNQSVAEVNSDTPEKVRKFIEDELIKGGRRISLDQALCHHVKEETLKTLVKTTLINSEQNSVGSFSYELSHDTLIPPIMEMAEKRRKLEEDERLEAERQEVLRIAIEKAEKERIEHEKETKRHAELLALEQARRAEAERAASFALALQQAKAAEAMQAARLAEEKAENERKERKKEAERQAELLALEQARAVEAERAANLFEENYRNQRIAARKQKKLKNLAILVAIIAMVLAGSSVLLGLRARNSKDKANSNLAKFLESDGNKLYNEENFEDARSRYQQIIDKNLLKPEKKTDSIRTQINLCIFYDSIKPLFSQKFNSTAGLIRINTLDALIKADSLIKHLEKLNYDPAKNKLDSLKGNHTEKAQKTRDNTLIMIRETYLQFPDSMYYPEAGNKLLKLQKLFPNDQEIIDLLKQVQ